jgi:hypothetical protein
MQRDEDENTHLRRSREEIFSDNVLHRGGSPSPGAATMMPRQPMATKRQRSPKGGGASRSLEVPHHHVNERLETTSERSSKWYRHSRNLGPNFSPGPFDIICAHGKEAWNHSGNKLFRALVAQATDEYSRVGTKAEPTAIVSKILQTIRSRGTGFVKQQEQTGGAGGCKSREWIEVGDLLAREKVGQRLRNALSNQYRSSIGSKKKRRRKIQVKQADSLHDLMESNEHIHQSMVARRELGTVRGNPSNDELMTVFMQEQINMLEHIKADKELVGKFLKAEVISRLIPDDTGTSDSEDGDVIMMEDT